MAHKVFKLTSAASDAVCYSDSLGDLLSEIEGFEMEADEDLFPFTISISTLSDEEYERAKSNEFDGF